MTRKVQKPTALKGRKLQTKPSAFSSYRDFLLALFKEIKKQDPDFTYTDLSTALGFSATGFVHQIIRGRRSLTADAGQRIIKALGLSGDERAYLSAMIALNNADGSEQRSQALDKIVQIKSRTNPKAFSADQIEYVSQWYIPVVRELIALADIDQSPEGLAAKIFPPIKPAQVKKSLELLDRLGMIKADASGRLKPTAAVLKTDAETHDLVFTKFHAAILDLSRDALGTVDQDERSITASTLRIRRGSLNRLKSMIHEFQMQLLGSEEPIESTDDIYQLNVQFFPVSRLKRKGRAS